MSTETKAPAAKPRGSRRKHSPEVVAAAEALAAAVTEEVVETVTALPTPAPAAPKKPMFSGTKELTKEQYELARQLKTLRQTIASLKKLEESAGDQVKKIMGDAETGTYEGVPAVKMGEREWSGYDGGILVSAFPEAAEAARVTKPYSVINVL